MRMLIIGPSWVGDMVMAQSLFRLLVMRHPGVEIDVLAPAWSRPILERMPEVRRAIDMPLGHGVFGWRERRTMGIALRDAAYAQAIVLPNSWKSALIPWFARIPQRTGWRGEMRYGLLNDVRVLDKAHFPLMVQRFAALALPPDAPPVAREAIPAPQLRVDETHAMAAARKHALDVHKPVLALCPGAEFGPAKQWPAEHYATLARYALDVGHAVWLFGSQKDRAVCEQIAAGLPAATVRILAGETNLAEAVDLMSLCHSVVSNDSGLMHVAAALDKPLVGIYGSTSPDFTPPLNRGARVASIDIECRPCFQRECPKGHLRCLRDLEPQQVFALLGEASTS